MSTSHIYIENAKDHVGEEVRIAGWLYNKRSSGKLHFLILRDGTGLMQAVVSKNDVPEDAFRVSGELAQECSCVATGRVSANTRSLVSVGALVALDQRQHEFLADLASVGISPPQLLQQFDRLALEILVARACPLLGFGQRRIVTDPDATEDFLGLLHAHRPPERNDSAR